MLKPQMPLNLGVPTRNSTTRADIRPLHPRSCHRTMHRDPHDRQVLRMRSYGGGGGHRAPAGDVPRNRDGSASGSRLQLAGISRGPSRPGTRNAHQIDRCRRTPRPGSSYGTRSSSAWASRDPRLLLTFVSCRFEWTSRCLCKKDRRGGEPGVRKRRREYRRYQIGENRGGGEGQVLAFPLHRCSCREERGAAAEDLKDLNAICRSCFSRGR